MEKKASILVVDDEAGLRDLFKAELQWQGYQVITAGDGQEGLRHLNQDQIDLVISDIKMPGMNGIELLKAVKDKDHDMPVVIMTGYASLETAMEAVRLGAYDYIRKPFANFEEEVLQVVEKAVERGKLVKANKRLTEELKIANSEMKKVNSKLRAMIAQLSVLQQTSQLINETREVESILDVALDTITLGLGVKACSIMLKSDGKEVLVIRRARGLSQKTVRDFKVRLGNGIIGKTIEKGESALILNYKDDGDFQAKFGQKDKDEIEGFLCVPLKAVGQVVGALNIHKLDGGASFDEDGQNLFSIIGAQIASPIALISKKGKNNAL